MWFFSFCSLGEENCFDYITYYVAHFILAKQALFFILLPFHPITILISTMEYGKCYKPGLFLISLSPLWRSGFYQDTNVSQLKCHYLYLEKVSTPH